jgi:hypothetical protein
MLIAILISRLGGNEMIEQLNRKAIQLTFGQERTFMRFEFREGNSAISLREQTIGKWPAVKVPPQKFTRLHITN